MRNLELIQNDVRKRKLVNSNSEICNKLEQHKNYHFK